MNERRALLVLLGLVTVAYMAGFVALYVDRLLPIFRSIVKALGS